MLKQPYNPDISMDKSVVCLSFLLGSVEDRSLLAMRFLVSLVNGVCRYHHYEWCWKTKGRNAPSPWERYGWVLFPKLYYGL